METLQKEFPSKLGMKDAISLTDFRDSLQEILGEELESIVMYGNATLHDYHPESYDKKVLIVVRNVDTQMLRKVMKPVYRLKKMGFEAMFITEENLISSTDVFPIKYHSMRESHVLVWGEDVVEKLDIDPIHIRLICEQELRNLSQDLDQYFLDKKGKELKQKLCGVITDFIETLRVAVLLKTKELPPWDDAIDSLNSTFSVDASILNEVMQLRNEEIKLNKKETEALYNRFMSFVDQMVGIVDRLE